MLRNYIGVALRNLWRNPSFSFINITGLAISMSVCLLVLPATNRLIGDQLEKPGSTEIVDLAYMSVDRFFHCCTRFLFYKQRLAQPAAL